MLLWFLSCSNITYTIPVMFLELLALEAAEQTDGIFHRNGIGGGLTVKPLLQCCSWSWGGLFLFYPMPGNFQPSFCISCTCSYTALGAYAYVYSRYIYILMESQKCLNDCVHLWTCKPVGMDFNRCKSTTNSDVSEHTPSLQSPCTQFDDFVEKEGCLPRKINPMSCVS